MCLLIAHIAVSLTLEVVDGMILEKPGCEAIAREMLMRYVLLSGSKQGQWNLHIVQFEWERAHSVHWAGSGVENWTKDQS